MTRHRKGIAAVAGITILLAASFAWLWLRPLLDPSELGQAEELASAALSDARAQTCTRPVLRGSTGASDATADFAALLDPHGRFATCATLVESRADDLRDALTYADGAARAELPADPLPFGAPDVPPAPREWEGPTLHRLLRRTPLAIESEILATCAGIDLEVERIASASSVCTPFPLGSSVAGVWLLRLQNVVAVFARDRARRGEPLHALELELDAIRLATDAARGRTPILGAMVSAGATRAALAQVELLLASDLGWDEATLRELEREMTVLSTTLPTPASWLADDSIAAALPSLARLGWAPPAGIDPFADASRAGDREDDEIAIALLLQLQAHRAELTCAADEAREVCLTRIRAAVEQMTRSIGVSAGWRVALGPRASRELRLADARNGLLTGYARYLAQALQTEAMLRAAWLLAEHRRLALAGSCPDAEALAASIATMPTAAGFGGTFEVLASTSAEYRPLDVCAPAWLAPTTSGSPVRLPLLQAYGPLLPVLP